MRDDTQDDGGKKSYSDLDEVSSYVLEVRIRAQQDLLDFVRRTKPDDADTIREMAEAALAELNQEVSVRARIGEIMARTKR
ncbi:hypothetical protein [Brevibacterium zhoupengii]|uniref:hypothetical protein n=1 Tax=Brevibacterium zhoupengii TaxID=2898795 RepID=UPI001E45619A|nr:hypothetical protein [Brevibacterium zhoupengii]